MDEATDPRPDAGVDDPIEKARQQMAGLDEEFHGRMAELEQRSKEAHDSYRATQERRNEQVIDDGSAAKSLGPGLVIAYTILGFPILGFGLGALLDRFIGGGGRIYSTFLGLGGCVAGIAIAIYLLNQQNKNS